MMEPHCDAGTHSLNTRGLGLLGSFRPLTNSHSFRQMRLKALKMTSKLPAMLSTLSWAPGSDMLMMAPVCCLNGPVCKISICIKRLNPHYQGCSPNNASSAPNRYCPSSLEMMSLRVTKPPLLLPMLLPPIMLVLIGMVGMVGMVGWWVWRA